MRKDSVRQRNSVNIKKVKASPALQTGEVIYPGREQENTKKKPQSHNSWFKQVYPKPSNSSGL